MKNKVKILLENILIESAEDRPNRPKIKLRAMWQDREERRIKQFEKILSQEVIEGNLDLSKEPIENIGNIRHVNGNLNLSYCTNLTSLPAGLTVNGDLNLYGCTSLTSLPADLKVNGSLDLSSCTSLTSLPANLTVKDALMLSNTNLTSLPANLTVKGNLWLQGCKSLISLPADLKVKGWLYLYRCQQSVIDQAIQMFGSIRVIYK